MALLWEAWEWSASDADLRAVLRVLMRSWRVALPRELAVQVTEGVADMADWMYARRLER